MKGRTVVHIPSDNDKYGSDQDKGLIVSHGTTGTGQFYIVISYNNTVLHMSLRTGIDLLHKLGKVTTNALTEAMLLFVKDK